jgi:tetratricopeptide (TPR) repeat protein
VTRTGTTLSLALNAMRDLPGANLEVSSAAQGFSRVKEVLSITPADTITREVRDVPAGAKYTMTLRDRNGAVVLQHTEDTFDYTPASEIKTGPQPAHRFPPAEERTPDDFDALGMDQELDGRVLEAMTTYREGLRRFPDSLELRRAAGRLAVGLKQFDAAIGDLGAVLGRVSNDREAAYYLGVAAAARRDNRRARLSWEIAQQFGAFRAPSLFALAALTAREGRLEAALATLQRLVGEEPEATRAGSMEVALLRNLRRTDELRARLRVWQRRDPTNATLRYEAVKLGAAGEPLWQHLAADPERILEVAVDYMRFGLYLDAIDVLARTYPAGPGVVSEPGMPRPEAYPLIAYYRGFCRHAIGEKGRADFDAASHMPTTYVFPNRAESLAVLQQAIEQNPGDATAHSLLGALYLSGGMTDEASREWESARQLNPGIPTLHRNMGYLVLRTGGPPDRAAELFREGTKHDARNVGLYFGLDEALAKAGRPAGERADALLAFPNQPKLPAALVYVLAQSLAEAGRFDEADRQFAGRFFPSEEGGVNVRQVYLEVKLRRAIELAKTRDCARALDLVSRLSEPVDGLEFTRGGLEAFLKSPRLAPMLNDVRAACPAR